MNESSKFFQGLLGVLSTVVRQMCCHITTNTDHHFIAASVLTRTTDTMENAYWTNKSAQALISILGEEGHTEAGASGEKQKGVPNDFAVSCRKGVQYIARGGKTLKSWIKMIGNPNTCGAANYQVV